MIEDYHIDLVQMMENAGLNLAHLARSRFLDGDPIDKRVLILAGSGGNGGGALACARRLHNWGSDVRVFLTRPGDELATVPAHQLDILRRMGVATVPSVPEAEEGRAGVIIDGIIGYSLSGAPIGQAAALIRWANAQEAPVLSLDLPSGLDATTGVAYSPCIRAAATMTLALPKIGLRAEGAARFVGELYLADIGVPPALYAKLGFHPGPLFAREDVVRLR